MLAALVQDVELYGREGRVIEFLEATEDDLPSDLKQSRLDSATAFRLANE
jgi:hypothetical protein